LWVVVALVLAHHPVRDLELVVAQAA